MFKDIGLRFLRVLLSIVTLFSAVLVPLLAVLLVLLSMVILMMPLVLVSLVITVPMFLVDLTNSSYWYFGLVFSLPAGLYLFYTFISGKNKYITITLKEPYQKWFTGNNPRE